MKVSKPKAFIIICSLLGFAGGLTLDILNRKCCSFPVLMSVGFFFGLFVGSIIASIILSRKRKAEKKAELTKITEWLPENAKQYVITVFKKMRYRRSVRIDVLHELVGHFEDSLKDCKTDEEKTLAAKKIISDFGDPKLLAILMRRAKKRCRPLWKKMIVRSFQAFGILILCLILYIIWFATGKPSPSVNYLEQANKMTRPDADERFNAAPLYLQAAEKIKNISDDIKNKISSNSYDANEMEVAIVQKSVTEHSDALDLVIKGSKLPYYWHKYSNDSNTTEMAAILMPHLGDYRFLAKAISWQAKIKAKEGHYLEAFAELLALYKMGNHLRSGTMIEQLVGIAIQAIAMYDVRYILNENQIEDQILEKLQHELSEQIAKTDFVVNISGQKLFMLDEIQRTFTTGHFSHISIEGLKRLNMMANINSRSEVYTQIPKALFNHPNADETRETAEKFYDFLQENFYKTPAELKAEGIDLETEAQKIAEGNILLEVFTPALSRIQLISYRSLIGSEATVLIIALERYKYEYQEYPDELQTLVDSGYIESIPIDPFSDKPIVYRKTDGDFILYSVGENMVDDGGEFALNQGRKQTWGNEGDAVFWPIPEKQNK